MARPSYILDFFGFFGWPGWIISLSINNLICTNSHIICFLSCQTSNSCTCCLIIINYNCFTVLHGWISAIFDFISIYLSSLFFPGYIQCLRTFAQTWNGCTSWFNCKSLFQCTIVSLFQFYLYCICTYICTAFIISYSIIFWTEFFTF